MIELVTFSVVMWITCILLDLGPREYNPFSSIRDFRLENDPNLIRVPHRNGSHTSVLEKDILSSYEYEMPVGALNECPNCTNGEELNYEKPNEYTKYKYAKCGHCGYHLMRPANVKFSFPERYKVHMKKSQFLSEAMSDTSLEFLIGTYDEKKRRGLTFSS
jgi:hypothetical protein